eukprot:gb/GEZJ01008553.1/.p1 GENE.gb/GEZJ01008553.1/~~gb/GEZJ01008553.1/.p1  ORF type:complete len:138 (-),score=18.10 gb/GEZJ01008553.1/:18-431(-)
MISDLETQSGKRLKRCSNDNGGKYMAEFVQSWLREKRVIWKPTLPCSPESNGKAERLKKTLQDKERTMSPQIMGTLRHEQLGDEANHTANYLRNRTFSKGPKEPYEAFMKKMPNVSHVRVFRSVLLDDSVLDFIVVG